METNLGHYIRLKHTVHLIVFEFCVRSDRTSSAPNVPAAIAPPKKTQSRIVCSLFRYQSDR